MLVSYSGMDNAIQELQQGNNGGILVWFNEILYRGGIGSDSCGEIEDAGSVAVNCSREPSFPAIANTIVFNYSHAQAWYFESAHKSTLLIRKKKRQFMTANDIMSTFAAGAEARFGHNNIRHPSASSPTASKQDRKTLKDADELAREITIIAQLVTRNLSSVSQKGDGGRKGTPLITYYTRGELERLLHHETISEASLLQEFIPPQGIDGGSGACQNYCFVANWQTSFCYVEKYTNNFNVDDPSKSSQTRGVTVDCTKWTENSTVKGHAAQARVTECCNALARHVCAVTGFHLRSIIAAFKVSSDDRLVLLYVQHVSVGENPRPSTTSITTHNRRPSSAMSSAIGGSRGPSASSFAMSADLDEESSWMSPEARKGSRRLQAESHRALRQLEQEADEKFSRIAPKSWDVNRARRRREQAAARIAEQLRLEAEAKKTRRRPGLHQRSLSRTSDESFHYPNSVTYNTAANLLERSPVLASPGMSFSQFMNNSGEGWGSPAKASAAEVSGAASPQHQHRMSRANSTLLAPTISGGAFDADVTPSTACLSGADDDDGPFRSPLDHTLQPPRNLDASYPPRRQSLTMKQYEELHAQQSEKRRTKLRISNLTWGMPSKLDTALLRKPNGGPFSVDYLAANVAAMGLRDTYLRCMNCNNSKEARLSKQ